MNIRDRKGLKQTASTRLCESSYDPRLLALLYISVSVGVSLVLAIVTYILQEQIGGTGGLAGIGTRSVLVTVQAVLQLASTLLIPFWDMGLIYTSVQLARGKAAYPVSLTAGFRRFGPVLRLLLLRAAITLGLCILCANLSSGIFLMTPLSNPLLEILQSLEAEIISGNAANFTIDDATAAAMAQTLLPVIPIFLILFLIIAVPILYRLRMSDYLLMEEKKTGAFEAVILSWRMTRGRVFSLFRLDLSFWWFYGLQALSVVLLYGDWLLSVLGITLPMSADVTYFLMYGLYSIFSVAVFWRFGSYVQTTYAVAYDALRYHAAMPLPKSVPAEDSQI